MSCLNGVMPKSDKKDKTSKSRRPSDAPKPPAGKYKYDGPTVAGESFPLFDDGRCFRVEAADDNTWYVYNDTLDVEMHVCYAFAPENGARQLPDAKTKVTTAEDGWTHCDLVVYPLQTAKYVAFDRKEVLGHRANTSAKPLSEEFLHEKNEEARAKTEAEENKVARIAAGLKSEEDLVYKCRKSNIMFVDMGFKPNQGSLRRENDEKTVNNLTCIAWHRPQDCVPEDTRADIGLFDNGINPGDIGQGQLGDCWLMCSMSVVANTPAMIEDLFRHPVSKSKQKKEQKAGAYRVYLNKCGWWRNVIVDSYLPTYNGSVYFGRNTTAQNELWVSLLEKAYAKVHGSYANIQVGDALNALQDLTGFPVYSFNDHWKKIAVDEALAKSFFDDLLRYSAAGYLISVCTPGTDDSSYNVGGDTNDAAFTERYKKAGLGMGHAYSVMNVRQFTSPDVRLLQIRSPWGCGETWTGPWGKNSDKWKKHSLVRRSCKPSKANDGTCWMEWGDIIKYFEGGGVCMVKDDWHDYRIKGEFVGIIPSIVLKIEPKKKQRIFFNLSQKDRRLLDPSDPNQQYKDFLIAVSCHNPEKDEQHVCAISTANPEEHPADSFTYIIARDVGMEMELDPAKGPYYVVPRIMAANRAGPKDFTLGMLTPERPAADGLQVSFLRLPEDSPILNNFMGYKPPVPDQLMVTQFQCKKRGGVPELWEGKTIVDSERVKEDFPFPC